MDPSERRALMLVRLIAFSLISFSVAELALSVALRAREPITVFSIVLKSLPLAGGILMLIKGRALAEWIDNLLDS